jgi:twitching motility protein PilJ
VIVNVDEINQNRQEEVFLSPVQSVSLDDRRNDSSAIALEDMFKVSSVSQKITLWGALIATIPAIVLGVTAYQVGNGLLLNKTKQAQKADAIVLANLAGNFLKQKTADVEVLQKLLVPNELEQKAAQPLPNSPKPNTKPPTNVKVPSTSTAQSPPITQQAESKQQLSNRLNLYAQAYPQYTSIALFGPTGDLISQSANSKTLQTISSDLFKRSTAANTNAIATVGKSGTHLYIFAPIKRGDSEKISMFLQVEVPIQQLVNELTPASNANTSQNTDLNRDFYIIDSDNKYVASSQSVTLGGDASGNFEMLADWRTAWQTSQSSEILDREQNGQMVAYVPIPKIQKNDLLNWDLVTSVDKTKAIAGNQNLLLVVGLGIASTPLLMLMIGYALSRKLSARLKHIRMALRDLREGHTDLSFGNLSTAGNDELSDISLSINKMSEQFQTVIQKQELEKHNLQLQVAKLFKVLAKLAREDDQEVKNVDLSDEKILFLGKQVRAEIVQRHAEVEQYRQQREEIQGRLLQMLKDVQALADGDLTVSTQSVDGSLANVAIFFDDVMRGLQNIIGQVKSSANQVNLSLGYNEQAINNLCDVSQRQLSMLTHSLDTMQTSKLSTSTLVGHSQQASESSQLVAEKISDSDRSIDAVMSKVGELQNTVAATAKRIKHLGMSSQKVVKAISTINEIAIKTNFLAINASLEASRTGDVSVGFVMVAEEVGELAARSVAASKEVESLLINIQAETNAAMASVESGSHQISESNTLAIAAKDSLQQIAQISQQIDGLMGAISEATISQVQTSEGVANLMHDIAHMAKTTIASSSEASKLIKTTRKYSGELQQSLIHFKTR